MDEEFKVRFVVDMGDTEKRVKRLKNDFVSMEDNEIHFKSNIGDINKNANSVFKNIRSMMEGVNRNPIWSNAKKQEYLKFFKGMEATANRAFQTMENRYSKLSQDLSSWDAQKNALELEVELKSGEIEKIQDEINKEMSKQGHVGSYDDLVKMQEEYNKLTQMKIKAQKGAEEAAARQDKPDYESWIRDLQSIDSYQQKLMDDMKNFKIGESTGGPDYEKIAKLREKWEEIVKEADELDKKITRMGENPAMEKKRQELEAIRIEYGRLMADMQGNPLDDKFKSSSLQNLNPQIENLNNGLDRSGQKIKWNTKLTEAWGKMMSRLKSRVMFSIVSMLNPIRIIRQAWSGFLDQNVKTKNTLKMIGLNLQKIIAPVLQKIADFILRIAQYANVLTKAWFNIDLFDKSVLSAKETEKEIKKINQLTAGFDELNVFKEETENNDNENNEVLSDFELPDVDTSKLKDWAENGFGKNIGQVLNWALEHPLETAGIYLGTRLVGGLLGHGIAALAKKGITKLFGGSAAAEGAKASGGFLGGLLGKQLYTGMSGQAVTVGKLLGGVALTAGGTALAISQAADAGKNWQDLTTKTKVAKVGLVGLGSAAAGLGAVMLGASGPVGWAVAGAVALGAFCIGMAQTQNGIGSVKDETEKWSEKQEILQNAIVNTQSKMSNYLQSLTTVKQLEEATGKSGEDLANAIASGKIRVEDLTAAEVQLYYAYINSKKALEELVQAQKEEFKAKQEEVEQHAKVLAANGKESGSYDELADHIKTCWENGTMDTEKARDLMSRAMADMSEDQRKTFVEQMPASLQQGLDPEKYASGFQKFGSWVEGKFKGWVDNWKTVLGMNTNELEEYQGTVDDLIGAEENLQQAMENKNAVQEQLRQLEEKAGMTADELREKIGKGEIAYNGLTDAQKALLKADNDLENAQARVDQALDTTGEHVAGLAYQEYKQTGDYKTFIETLQRENENGNISSEKMNKTFGEVMSDMTTHEQDMFKDYMKQMGLSTKEAEGFAQSSQTTFQRWASKVGGFFQDVGQRIGNLFSGKGFRTDIEINASANLNGINAASLDIGTNYVPNDGFAYIHKGEAVVPAKYNNPYKPQSSNSDQVLAEMTKEITSLRNLISQGIPVTGEFVQRGSDLYATVERAKDKRGNQPLSNPSYAR